VAIVIIGGLATSTLLNLFVLPPLYLLVALAAVRAVGSLCLRPWGSQVRRRTIEQAGGSTMLPRRPDV